MTRWCLALVLACLCSLATAAQAPTLFWDASSNTVSAAEATALTYTLYVNNGPAIAVPGATCTGAVPPFACSAPLPAGVPTLIGTKLELTARSGTGVESPRSVPFTSPPTAPTNLKRS